MTNFSQKIDICFAGEASLLSRDNTRDCESMGITGSPDRITLIDIDSFASRSTSTDREFVARCFDLQKGSRQAAAHSISSLLSSVFVE